MNFLLEFVFQAHHFVHPVFRHLLNNVLKRNLKTGPTSRLFNRPFNMHTTKLFNTTNVQEPPKKIPYPRRLYIYSLLQSVKPPQMIWWNDTNAWKKKTKGQFLVWAQITWWLTRTVDKLNLILFLRLIHLVPPPETLQMFQSLQKSSHISTFHRTLTSPYL